MSFKCLDFSCNGNLEQKAITDSVDSGVCGDGYRTVHYLCNLCKERYYRIDVDSWWPFSYEKEQQNIRKYDEHLPAATIFPNSCDIRNNRIKTLKLSFFLSLCYVQSKIERITNKLNAKVKFLIHRLKGEIK